MSGVQLSEIFPVTVIASLLVALLKLEYLKFGFKCNKQRWNYFYITRVRLFRVQLKLAFRTWPFELMLTSQHYSGQTYFFSFWKCFLRETTLLITLFWLKEEFVKRVQKFTLL